MSNPPPGDSLVKLRSDLRHFEESGDFGENTTVIEIKAHILRRIAEFESVLRRTKTLEAAAFPMPPRAPNRP
jgi:ABC-type uncharacterized transport system auxiliary subunit